MYTRYNFLSSIPPISHTLPNGTLIPKIPVFSIDHTINLIYFIDYNIKYNSKYNYPKDIDLYYNKAGDYCYHHIENIEHSFDIFLIPSKIADKIEKEFKYYYRPDFVLSYKEFFIEWKTPEPWVYRDI